MRTRRLMADAKQMAEVFARSERVKVRPIAGDPPEAYHVEYAVRGLQRGKGNKPTPREHHLVEIRLTADYPRLAPQCKMLTPRVPPQHRPGHHLRRRPLDRRRAARRPHRPASAR
jgi:hypothetical protein